MSIQLLGISQAVFKKLHSGPRRPPLLPKAALQIIENFERIGVYYAAIKRNSAQSAVR